MAPIFQGGNVYAAGITDRSLTLQAGPTDGGSLPGGVVKHKFDFTLPSTSNIGSIKFQYCTLARDNPADGGASNCVVPTGLVTTGASLFDQTGATGFSIVDEATNGTVIIGKATPAAPPAGGVVSYTFDTVTNPTAVNTTFFVRISTYASSDGSGSETDTGTVAASTANAIQLSGVMPESLIFCTGGTVSMTAGQPDCTTATAGNITFNQLFSPSDTATATSQMAASTNALSGYSITVNGPTLKSGSNTITAMATTGPSVVGTAQFGMNMVANATPGVGADVNPVVDVPNNLLGTPAAGYETADNFRFVSGESVAGSTGPTNSQIFTASYIVNVPGSLPAGTYATTLTYICT
ncbi:MAG TPA: hypothetical protein VFK03_01390, partial [Candidatus Saccharimonadales bacterium]|nr:hypothetical protein [Candidatus Saccharimonadales bacterium]